MTEFVPVVIVALVSLGMAAAFYSADPASPTSRVLALAFAATGLSYLFAVPLGALPRPIQNHPVLICNLASIVETVSLLAFLEWILRVRRTVPAGDLHTALGDYALRFVN